MIVAKPLLLRRADLVEALVRDVNSCELPIAMVVPVLEDILKQAQNLMQKQYEEEKRAYEEAVEKEASTDGGQNNTGA